MYDNTIQQALGDISDTYLESAMDVYERKRKARKRWDRVVACAAVLALLLGAMFFWPVEENYVTGPGILVVRAYETDEPELSEENSILLQEGITVPMEYTYQPNISWTEVGLGLPFRFSIPEKDYENGEITFEIWLSGGDFENMDYLLEYSDYLPGRDDSVDEYDALKARYAGGHCTIKNNTTLWWNAFGHIFDEKKREVYYVEPESDQVFVDIILRADEHIIGYAVIEILDVDGKGGFVYHTRMLKSVSFPKVEGAYQTVSEEYVKKQFRIVHDQA